ncbi:MAG: hypothetical protein JWO95_1614, partial [Verrucomicrobiales bacterium]|nr:hypothetical protein [Verrucomicrobiales bacterium]
ANCAFCHRPGGVSQAGWDGRFDTAITNQSIVNAAAFNTLCITGARVIRSGSITQSVMRVRLNAMDNTAMPPLAKTLVDPTGVALLDSWIVSLTNAPNFSVGADAISAFLQVHGQQGMAYNLQGSTNLSSWSQLTTLFDSSLRRIPDTNFPARFFRLQLPP